LATNGGDKHGVCIKATNEKKNLTRRGSISSKSMKKDRVDPKENYWELRNKKSEKHGGENGGDKKNWKKLQKEHQKGQLKGAFETRNN